MVVAVEGLWEKEEEDGGGFVVAVGFEKGAIASSGIRAFQDEWHSS